MKSTREQRKDLITAELVRIDVLVRANEGKQAIVDLADLLADELSMFDDEAIRAAMREHSRISQWMPKLYEIIQLCNQVMVDRRHRLQLAQAALPCPTELSEQQRQLNLSKITELRNRLAQRKGLKSGGRHVS